MTNSLNAGDAAEYSQSISPSHTPSSARGAKQSTSTFKDGLTQLVNNPKVFAGQECFVGQVLANLNNDESLLLHTALADKRIRHVDLVRLCEAEGYKMSEATMRRHRARGCRCDK